MSGDNPLQKLKSVDWRGLVKSATNKVKKYAMNLSDLEIKVEEATNMETWGPHGSAMSGLFCIFFPCQCALCDQLFREHMWHHYITITTML